MQVDFLLEGDVSWPVKACTRVYHLKQSLLINEFLSISIQKESIVPPNTFYLFKISSFVGLQKQILVEHLYQRMELQIHCKEEYNKGDASTVYLFWTVRSKCSTNNLIVGAPAWSGTSDIWKSNQRRNVS